MLDRSSTRHPMGLDRMGEGRRVLDLAQGILIAHRRYSSEAAFGELVAVAHRHDVSVSAVASALVVLAAGPAERAETTRLAAAVAQLTWGDLYAESETRTLRHDFGETAV